jgi:hypothetical protein
MSAPNLILPLMAEEDVGDRLFIKAGLQDGQGVVATGPGDRILGVSDTLPTETGALIDLHVDGLVEIWCGGVVNQGDFLTADATGRAVVATGGQRYGGIAWRNGVEGAIIDILVVQGIG